MIASFLLAAVASSSQFLVVDDLVIGFYENKKWNEVPETATTDQTYILQEVGVGKLGKQRSVKGYEPADGIGGVFVRSERDMNVKGVFTSGFKPSVPRKIDSIGLTNKTYLKVVADFLKTKNIKTPARLVQAFSVDLDGNGTKEVILNGRSAGLEVGHTFENKKGAYSVILLRHIAKNGKPETLPLSADLMPNGEFGYVNSIRAIADIEGEGRMELILSSDYYEGQSASIVGFWSGKAVSLAASGAGA